MNDFQNFLLSPHSGLLIVGFLFLFLLLWAFFSIIIWSIKNGISPQPTSSSVKKAVLNTLPSEMKGTIYELGSGWGLLAIALARKYPLAKIIGYETSPIPYLFSKVLAYCLKLPNIEIYRKNFYECPLQDASLIVCYLYPAAMDVLKLKFEKELTSGTTIMSHTFAIPGWKPKRKFEANDLYHTPIYYYQID
jgi:hypothetical protein